MITDNILLCRVRKVCEPCTKSAGKAVRTQVIWFSRACRLAEGNQLYSVASSTATTSPPTLVELPSKTCESSPDGSVNLTGNRSLSAGDDQGHDRLQKSSASRSGAGRGDREPGTRFIAAVLWMAGRPGACSVEPGQAREGTAPPAACTEGHGAIPGAPPFSGRSSYGMMSGQTPCSHYSSIPAAGLAIWWPWSSVTL